MSVNTITIEDVLEIAADLHECQNMFNDPFYGQGHMDADGLKEMNETKQGISWQYDVTKENFSKTDSGYGQNGGQHHEYGIATALVYKTKSTTKRLMTVMMTVTTSTKLTKFVALKMLVQNENKNSKAAERARNGSKICWLLPTGWKSSSNWGLIEDGVLKRSCSGLEGFIGPAKRKSDNSSSSSDSSSSNSSNSNSSNSSNKKKKQKVTHIVSSTLPIERPNFRLTLSDFTIIHLALHDEQQLDSVHLPDAAITLKIEKSNARPIPGRICKIIVDQTRPKGYSKVMTQNLNKKSKVAVRGQNGEKLTWILPMDAVTGKHLHSSKWGRIENDADTMIKPSPLAVEPKVQ